MAFIPTQDCIRFAVRHTLFGQDVVNTLWFQNTVADLEDPNNLDLLAGALATAWITHMMPLVTVPMQLVEVTATSQQTPTSPSVSKTYATNGNQVGSALPSSNCFAVSFKTANRGRSARGRNYISGLTASNTTDNSIDSSQATAFLQAYADINADMQLADCFHVVVSFQEFGVPRLAGLKQLVTSYSFSDLFIDSQRRRLNGRGT